MKRLLRFGRALPQWYGHSIPSHSVRAFSDKLTAEEIASTPVTPEQMQKAGAMDAKYRSHHMEVESKLDAEEYDMVRRKRMIYRSKQRGWLEADLLLGSWAVDNVPLLTAAELDEYEILLKEETIDIFNYVSGKDELPPHLSSLGIMKKVQSYAKTGNMNSPEGYEATKKAANLT